MNFWRRVLGGWVLKLHMEIRYRRGQFSFQGHLLPGPGSFSLGVDKEVA